VTNAVNNSGVPERNPYHLYAPYDKSNPTEQQYINQQHEQYAVLVVGCIDFSFYPVVGRAFTIGEHYAGFFSGKIVVIYSSKKYVFNSMYDGAMRIALDIAESMMLAMYGYPLSSNHTCG